MLAQIGLRLGTALEHATPADVIYAQSALQLLVTHLIRHHAVVRQAVLPPAGTLTPQQLQRVIDFTQAHLDQIITLDSLARQAGYSLYHFARLFRQQLRITPRAYRRMRENAADM